uniref:Uncharacterized protein n=1 Tax=Eutreptiella gymnastica TaxID=73025 RepID=A0A7S4FMS6_9EUGL
MKRYYISGICLAMAHDAYAVWNPSRQFPLLLMRPKACAMQTLIVVRINTSTSCASRIEAEAFGFWHFADYTEEYTGAILWGSVVRWSFNRRWMVVRISLTPAAP